MSRRRSGEERTSPTRHPVTPAGSLIVSNTDNLENVARSLKLDTEATEAEAEAEAEVNAEAEAEVALPNSDRDGAVSQRGVSPPLPPSPFSPPLPPSPPSSPAPPPPPSSQPSPPPAGGPGADVGSAQDAACRICQEGEQPLSVWCDCKGTIGLAHQTCLEQWIARSGASRCELCGFAFHMRRVPRYGSRLRSLRPWLSGNVMAQTALVADGLGALLCLAVGAGTAVVCALGVRSLRIQGTGPDEQHLNPDALFLQLACCLASAIAAIWFALAIRFHVRVWLRWWGHQFDVRVVPRSAESLRKAASRSSPQADVRNKEAPPPPPSSAPLPLPLPPPPAVHGRPWCCYALALKAHRTTMESIW